MENSDFIEFLNIKIDQGDIRAELFRELEDDLRKMNRPEGTPIKIVFSGLQLFNSHNKILDPKVKRIFEKLNQWEEFKPYANYFISTCYYFEKKFEDGIAFINNWINKDKVRIDLALEALGFYYSEKKKNRDALIAFDRAITVNLHREPLCRWGKSQIEISTKTYENALENLFLSFGNNEKTLVRALCDIVSIYKTLNRHGEALSLIEQHISNVSTPYCLSSLSLEKAEVFNDLQKYSDANVWYKKAFDIKYEINRSKIVTKWAYNLSESNDLETAITLLESDDSIVSDTEDRFEVLCAKAKIYEEKDNFDEAFACLDLVIKGSSRTELIKSCIRRKIKIDVKRERWIQCNRWLEELQSKSITEVDKKSCFYERGKVCEAKNDQEKAYDFYKKSAETSDDDERCKSFTQISKLFIKKKNFEQAKEYIDQAISINSDLKIKSMAYFIGADVYHELKKKLDAIEYLNKSLSLNPSENHKVRCFFSFTNIMFSEHNFNDALKYVGKVAEHTENVEFINSANLYKGIILKHAQRFDESIATLTSAIESSQDINFIAELKIALSSVFIDKNQTESAAKLLEEMSGNINIEHSTRSTIFNKLARIEFSNKNFGDALRNFMKSIDLDEDSLDMNIWALCICFVKQDRIEEGIKYFEEKTKSFAGRTKTLLVFGKSILFREAKRYQDALDCLSILQIDSKDELYPYMQINISRNYLELGNTKDALKIVKDIEPILRSEKKDSYSKLESFCELAAEAYLKEGNYELSKYYLEEAISLGSTHASDIFEIDKKISKELETERHRKQQETLILNDYEKNPKFLTKSFNRNKAEKFGLNQGHFICENKHIHESFINLTEFACHYTSAEVALFNILPSDFNHDQKDSSSNICFRLNSLGKVNDIEEGEFRLKSNSHSISALERDSFSRLKTQIKKEIKVYCLTWSNIPLEKMTFSNAPFLIPPLWSTYAHRHSGVCIVFDLNKLRSYLEDYFKKIDVNIFKIQRVIYAYPQFQNGVNHVVNHSHLVNYTGSNNSIKNFLAPDSNIDSNRFNVFFYKPPHWNYENEIRVVVHCEKEGPLHTYLPPDCVHSVVLGAEVKAGFKTLFEKVCKKNHWHLFEYVVSSESPIEMVRKLDL